MKELNNHQINIIIVSLFGVKRVGGVEAVTNHLKDIWEKNYRVRIIDYEVIKRTSRMRFLFGRHYTLDSILVSLYLHRYAGFIKKNNRIIITQGYNAPFVKADIHFSHGTMRGYKVAMEGEKTRWKFHSLFEKLAARQAKVVVAVGEGVKQHLMHYYKCKPDKIRVISNCINTQMFYPLKVSEQRADTNILFCGRLEKRKGVEELLRLALALESESHLKLLIATMSDLNTELFAGLKNTKIFRNLELEEINSFYNKGDVMFFPSLYEGMPLVVLECLSAGVPVIGNPIPSLSILADNDTEGVFLRNNKEIDLDMLKRIALQYRSDKIKTAMHEMMEKQYGMAVYEEKIQALIREYIEKGK